jgi:hypothetical protein
MNTYYIVVETNFYGPRLGFAAGDLDEDTFDEVWVLAADHYKSYTENADVPYDIIHESVQLSMVTTKKPISTDIKW